MTLSGDTVFLWWLSLGIALFVVVPVVVLLLHALLRSVVRTERAVIALWNTATSVARNTATTWQLDGTGDALDALRAETLRHYALLDGAARAASDPEPTWGRS
jgi:hypothetical protein